MVDWKVVKDIAATVFRTENCTIDPEGLTKIDTILTEAGFRRLFAGRNRLSYLSPSGRNVVKIPLNDYGAHDNNDEAFHFRRERAKWFPLARCRLFCDGLLLVMEWVEIDPNWEYSDLPEWATWVDSGQVGLNRKGEFVAYDYGSN